MDDRVDALHGQIVVTDPVSRTFLVRASLEDKQVRLLPGMSASAVLRIDTGREGAVVYRDALIRYPDGRITVWTVDIDGETATVSEIPVETGLGFNGMVAVSGGLAADALVVVRGNESLRDGQQVVVRMADKTEMQ